MSVARVMEKEVVTALPAENLRQAALRMSEADVGCLVVVAGDASGRVVGVLSREDLCTSAARSSQPLEEIPISHALSAAVHRCRPEDLLLDALELMQRTGARRLPVVDQAGHLLGLISLSDVAAAAANDELGLCVLSPRKVCRVVADVARVDARDVARVDAERGSS